MHAKKVFGKWWGRRGRTRNQKTNSGGKPAPMPPWGPRPLPTSWESVGEEKLPDGAPRPDMPPASQRTEGKGEFWGTTTNLGFLCISLGLGALVLRWTCLEGMEKPCRCPLCQMSTKWVSTKMSRRMAREVKNSILGDTLKTLSLATQLSSDNAPFHPSSGYQI